MSDAAFCDREASARPLLDRLDARVRIVAAQKGERSPAFGAGQNGEQFVVHGNVLA